MRLLRLVGNSRLGMLILLTLTAPAAPAMTWSLMLQQGQIALALPDIRSESWAITGLYADVKTAVDADNRTATIRFKPGSRLRAARVVQQADDEPLQLDDVRVELADVTSILDLAAPGSLLERSTATGQVSIAVGELQHPRLKSQGWRFDGTMDGPLTDLEIEGQLRSDSGLVADLTVRHRAGELLAVSVVMAIEGEQGSKAMTDTFTDWPAALELSAGRVHLEVDVRQHPTQPLALDSQLDFESVDGLLDRTAISDLSGRLLISLEQNSLVAGFRDVTIGQINAGIGLGPVRFLADYRAPRADLSGGVLDIYQATATFLDGRLRVAPGTIDLARKPVRLPVDVYGASLARLLQVYPAEGLEGTGELTGRIPVRISEAGIEVAQGLVSAIAPGGLLRLPADRLRAMLGSSQAVELVVEALQNFHYSVLQSTIDYDEEGKLVLDLRLEGENPEVRGGQPVVLNINLEEDIPALLTSLQLSGRVNEAVTERVRKRLQQSGQETVP